MLPFESLSMTTQTTAKLIEHFLEYARSKKPTELEAPDWKSLEESYVAHLKWRFNYPQRLFGQQMICSWIITGLVLLLVTSGLVFSLVQLYWAMKVGDISSLKTDMEIETAGKLSFRSSLVGAALLVISLAFFYLYLRHVFAIRHPVPPHVGLAETDALKVRGHQVEISESKADLAKKKGQTKGKANSRTGG